MAIHCCIFSNNMPIDVVMAMRVFHAVVDAGSFAAGADRLDLSRGMATRYLAQLEQHLGVRLLHRTTRKLSLTSGGSEYYQRSSQILAAIDEAEAAAAQESAVPRGVLRITTSTIVGVTVLADAAVEYLKEYPEVEIDVSISERVVDLVDEGFDLALRIARQLDPGLIARPVLQSPFALCASAGYLRRHGTPKHPQDLLAHNCLHLSHVMRNEWRFRRGKEDHTMRVKGSLRGNNGVVLMNAAIAGLGLTFEPRFLLDKPLREKKLVQLLPAWQTDDACLYAVWANRKFLPPKVRSFVDFLVAFTARSSRRA